MENVADPGQAGAMPGIGVIIATYNRAHLVSRAIESVLGQCYPNVSAIVVDDGSSDGTRAVLRRFDGDHRVSLVWHERNRGASAAFNTGLDNLGDVAYFALLGSDDALLPGAVETLVKVFAETLGNYSLVMGRAQDMLSHEATGALSHLAGGAGPITYDDALAGRFVGDFWVLARRDLLQGARFEERARGGEGSVWWRMLGRKPGWVVADVVLEVDRSGEDRLSLPAYNVATARGKMWAEKAMLDAVGQDQRRSYPARYARALGEMAKWAALGGDRPRARAAARASIRVVWSTRPFLIWGLSYLPSAVVERAVHVRRAMARGRPEQ